MLFHYIHAKSLITHGISPPRRPCWERRAPAPCSPPPSRCHAAAARNARRRPREPWRRATAASPHGSPGRGNVWRGTVDELFNKKWGFTYSAFKVHLGMTKQLTQTTKPQAIGLSKEVGSLQFSRTAWSLFHPQPQLAPAPGVPGTPPAARYNVWVATRLRCCSHAASARGHLGTGMLESFSQWLDKEPQWDYHSIHCLYNSCISMHKNSHDLSWSLIFNFPVSKIAHKFRSQPRSPTNFLLKPHPETPAHPGILTPGSMAPRIASCTATTMRS